MSTKVRSAREIGYRTVPSVLVLGWTIPSRSLVIMGWGGGGGLVASIWGGGLAAAIWGEFSIWGEATDAIWGESSIWGEAMATTWGDGDVETSGESGAKGVEPDGGIIGEESGAVRGAGWVAVDDWGGQRRLYWRMGATCDVGGGWGGIGPGDVGGVGN